MGEERRECHAFGGGGTQERGGAKKERLVYSNCNKSNLFEETKTGGDTKNGLMLGEGGG